MSHKILIVGSGITGIKASYNLASIGAKVTLVEPRTFTGGTLMQLDEQFPTDACGICRMQPRISGNRFIEFCPRKDFFFHNVEIWRDTEVIKITENNSKKKQVEFRRKGSHVDDMLCIGCGKCSEVCPVKIPDEFDARITQRKAIDRASPHSIPSLYNIDENKCTRCGECIKICPTNAIKIGDDEIFSDEFDAILLTPGFEEFTPGEILEYGYGLYKNVITSIELERMFSKTNVTSSEPKIIINGTTPNKVAFIQCVGSRIQERPYCSSACCMYAMKEARHIKTVIPDAVVKIFFMDIRAFGKDYYRYALDTKSRGIEFIQCRIPKIYQDENTQKLKITYETDDGSRIHEEFDMVVLSIGQVVTESVKSLLKNSGIETDEWGFVKPSHPGSLETNIKNIFVAGSITGPKDIAESVCEASSASAEICERLGITQKFETITWQGASLKKGNAGIILCRCVGIISDRIDLESIIGNIQNKKNVSNIDIVDALCTKQGLAEFKNLLKERNYETIIIGACQSNAYLARYSQVAQSATQKPPDIRIVDLRKVVWEIEQNKQVDVATSLILMELAGATHSRQKTFTFEIPKYKKTLKKAVVIGGGISGLSSAITLANVGVPVTLIEKNTELGGSIKNSTGKLFNTTNKSFIASLLTKAGQLGIEILTSTKIREITGGVGNFKVWIENAREELIPVEAGTIIIATGAKEHRTQAYNSSKIILWDEFEKILENEIPNEVVFIQCVDARDENRPWCSRICCAKTMELTIRLKNENPNAKVWILYRDIMTYGHHELSYNKAREQGALFIRYTLEHKPTITIENGMPIVNVIDSIIGTAIEIRPEYVILQTGLDPMGDNILDKYLPKTLGFWDSLDPKFSVHETKEAGIFVAGSGRTPMKANEAIIDGKASAMEALKYLIVDELPNRGNVAYVRERFCTGCQYCIPACLYNARVFDDTKNKVYVMYEQCMSCGSCSVACPSEATVMLGEDKNSMFAKIFEAVK